MDFYLTSLVLPVSSLDLGYCGILGFTTNSLSSSFTGIGWLQVSSRPSQALVDYQLIPGLLGLRNSNSSLPALLGAGQASQTFRSLNFKRRDQFSSLFFLHHLQ